MSGPISRRKPVGKLELEARGRRILAQYEAIYIAGPSHAIPRKAGDNMLGRPIRFGTTAAIADNISGSYNRAVPYYDQGVLFRIWTRRDGSALLKKLIYKLFQERFDSLDKGWWEAGPDFKLAKFQEDLWHLAYNNFIEIWSDADIEIHISREVQRELRAEVYELTKHRR
jgi:hypothetical protein